VEWTQPAARMAPVPSAPTVSGRPTVPGSPVRPPRLRSPLARAVVPVLGGLAVLALIFLVTWSIAALMSHSGSDATSRLAPPTFPMGSVTARADSIAKDGPIVLADLHTTKGDRTLVVDHEGTDPTNGWRVYWGYPADRPSSCTVTQVRHTQTFVDCEGRKLDVTQLAKPEGVHPTVIDGERLEIDLRAVTQR
jgi:hypothetical protein